MTLALAYASIRGQATLARLAENANRAQEARLAAESGMSIALRKMSDGTWAGITSQVHGDLGPDAWYEVSFATGDPRLEIGDPNYAEYPFRVTVTALGYASDPSQPAVAPCIKCGRSCNWLAAVCSRRRHPGRCWSR